MKFRTLIVDGNRNFRTLCANVLRRSDEREFYVTQASCGRDALEVVNRQSFELVLVSGSLSDMLGADLIRKLRQGALQSTPIVLLSDGDTPTIIDDARRCGASTYLPRSKAGSGGLVSAINGQLQKMEGHPSLFHSDSSEELTGQRM